MGVDRQCIAVGCWPRVMFSMKLMLHDNEIIGTDLMEVGSTCGVLRGISRVRCFSLMAKEEDVSVIWWYFDPGAFAISTDFVP